VTVPADSHNRRWLAGKRRGRGRGFAQPTVAAWDDGRRGRGLGIRTTDGGRPERRRLGGAELTLAVRDEGGWGFTQLTVAGRAEGGVREGGVRSQRRREGRFRSRSVRRFPCGTPGCCQGIGIATELLRAGLSECRSRSVGYGNSFRWARTKGPLIDRLKSSQRLLPPNTDQV